MNIVKERKIERWIEYSRRFSRVDGSGYIFDCDKDGNLLPSVTDTSLDTFHQLVNNKVPGIIDNGILKVYRTFTTPAIGRCECGNEVTLARFTNTCSHCGRDYNFNGDLLAHREQWGEETGEHISEILNIR